MEGQAGMGKPVQQKRGRGCMVGAITGMGMWVNLGQLSLAGSRAWDSGKSLSLGIQGGSKALKCSMEPYWSGPEFPMDPRDPLVIFRSP